MRSDNFLLCLLLLLLLGCLTACSSTPVDTTSDGSDYFNRHTQLMASLPATANAKGPQEKFQAVFADFNVSMTEVTLRDLYAEELYFNDTLVTLNTLDELVDYMAKTAENTKSSTVEIVDIAKSDTDYYLRWVMEIEFEARGKPIKSKSIGMTQLRFNDEGKVVFHQDYWDSANAFYQHLPIVGGLVKRIKNGLH